MKTSDLGFSGMRTKLMMIFLILVIVPIAFISYGVNSYVKNQVLDNFVISTTKEITQVNNMINTFFASVSDNCDLLANDAAVEKADQTITTYINKKGDGTKMTPSQNGGIEQEIYNSFLRYAQTHPNTAYLYMGTTHGGYIQWPESKVADNYDPRERLWYKTAMNNKGKVVRTAPYYYETDNSTYVDTVKTISNNSGEIMGVQVLSISLNRITEEIKTIKVGKTGYLMLVDSDGTIIANPNKPEYNFKKISELDIHELNKITEINSDYFYANIDKQRNIVNVYTSPETNWKFVAIIPEVEAMASASQIQKTIVILALIFVAAGLLAAFIISKKIAKPIAVTASYLDTMKTGDFSKEFPENLLRRKDEIGVLGKAVKDMCHDIGNLIKQVKDSSGMVRNTSNFLTDMTTHTDDATKEVVGAVRQIALAAAEQARELEISSSKTNELAERIEIVSKSVEEMGKISSQTSGLNLKGLNIMKSLIDKSVATKESAQQVNDLVLGMDKMSGEISAITETIRQIAEQTNLLALNAAIEAARAGEHGRGFAVVAEEVRKLAEESGNATKDINKLIGNLQNQTKDVVLATKKLINFTNEQENSVNETEEIFRETENGIGVLDIKVAEVKEQNRQMEEKKDMLISSIDNISAVSEETAASTEEVSASMDEQAAAIEQITRYSTELKSLAGNLQRLIEKFVI
ncbi:methyl-accepting chemotaxis protein [Desulfosporosinus youngiae]|uniref:Methyl-accepting chemotaxis protein n=1 Tax=Desulfosporosinus youngiae DSM 17734 TaxID=768710 RepID=H5Y1J0_9FIRM|nr:methyl-accepting chemotaxis protein [Desulfosporosinus youngiae]EHQ87603.1 methyl-accepting chemotaxis protein [Desulfosporosinus youngiae DSM 17734]